MSAVKTYEDYSQSPDGWNVSATLKLEDDGRFVYEEAWTDYTNVSLYGGAEGRWRRDGSLFVFQAGSIEGSMYFPWVVGQELQAVEQGGALDFGRGWRLREPPEREVNIPVRNNGYRPLTVRVEPWGISHVLERGEGLRIIAHGPWSPEEPEVVRGADEVVYYGWSGSRVEVAREPKPAKPPTPPVKPPAPKPPPPVAGPAFPQFEPVTPSPELAARIRQWIEKLPTEGMQDWTGRLCKKNDAIPLHCTQIYLWALRADGEVLSIDHESFSQRAERENNAVTAYAALAQGAHDYPELAELLAHNPEGVLECKRCGGKGWTQAEPPAQGTDSCHWCDGMGWHEPRVPR